MLLIFIQSSLVCKTHVSMKHRIYILVNALLLSEDKITELYKISCNEFIPRTGPFNTMFELLCSFDMNLVLFCYAKFNSLITLDQASVAFELHFPASVVKLEQRAIVAEIGIVSSPSQALEAKAQVIVTIDDNNKVVIPFRYTFSRETMDSMSNPMDWDYGLNTLIQNETTALHMAAGEGNSVLVGRFTFSNQGNAYQVDQFNRVPSDFAETFQHEAVFHYLQQIMQLNTQNKFSSYIESTKNTVCMEMANKLLSWQAKLETCVAQIESISAQVVQSDPSIAQLMQSARSNTLHMMNARKQTINIVGSDIAIGWIFYVLGGAIQKDGRLILPIQLAFANVDIFFVHELNHEKWNERADLTLYIPNGGSKMIENVCQYLILIRR